jgi:putative transposase
MDATVLRVYAAKCTAVSAASTVGIGKIRRLVGSAHPTADRIVGWALPTRWRGVRRTDHEDTKMPNYRRAYVPAGTYFLTITTESRIPLFADTANVTRLRRALEIVRAEQPFEVVAAVVLPDHMHFIWALPRGDAGFSKRVGRMKVLFTRALSATGTQRQLASPSRTAHRESGVWQRRFWEHVIRDEQDLERHVDYIHYNPVKHRLATCPHAWAASSFRQCSRKGWYELDWGCSCRGPAVGSLDFADMASTVGE